MTLQEIQQQFHELQVKQIEARLQIEQLRSGLERTNGILTGISDGAWSLTWPDLEIVYLNPATEEIYGRPLQDFNKNPALWQEVVHPEDQHLTRQAFEQLRETGAAERECRILRPDGSIAWVSDKSRLVFDKNNNPVRVDGICRDITDRKQAETALAESLSRYEELSNRVPVGVYIVWLLANGRVEFEYVSDRWCEIHQARREDVLTDSRVVNDLVHPDDREAFLACNRKAFLDKKPFLWEGRFIAGSEVRWLRIESTPVSFDNGDTRWFGVTQDISEHKFAEDELRESEERYRTLFERTANPIMVIDDKGNYINANESALNFFECSREELLGKNVIDFNPPGKDQVLEEHLPAWETGGVLETEYLIKGKVKTLILTITPGMWSGQPVVFGDGKDITERKWAEEERRKSEERYRTILNEMSEGYQEVDLSGNFTFFNEAFLQIFGYGRSEMLGTNFKHYAADEAIAKKVYRLYNEMYKSGVPIQNSEWDIIRKDGERRTLEFYASVVRDSADVPTGFRGIVRDITDRKKAEIEQERLQAQLAQAQKMESVGRLAGGVAHDFNNKLAIINGYAEMTIDMMDPSDPLREMVHEIYKAGNQSAGIVRQLLAFARKQTVSPVELDLNDSISSMLKMLRRLIGENIDLAWHPGANLWPVKIDPSQVDQIMANLAVNSRDAIPDVGKLTIETKNTIVDDNYSRTNPEAIPGRYVTLSVSDDGCGIEKGAMDHLFEPYYTTKEVGKGTGLGLPTIYGILKQNKGFVNVYSEPGQGTTFRLYFPSSEKESTISHSAEKSRGKVPMGSETILLVEDEPAILKMGREMIRRLGYTVLTAENPSEAMKIAGEYEGTIHLLITDVVMPEMNGRDLSAQLTKTHPGIKTLYMSGYTANVIAHHGVLDEGVQFIQKPFSMKDLAVKVRETFGWE